MRVPCLTGLLLSLLFDPTRAADANSGSKVVGYYAQWSAIPVSEIDGNRMTHLAYAFANLDVEGCRAMPGDTYLDTEKSFGVGDECSCCGKGNYNQLFQLRKSYPHLQILLSIGGWTWSSSFAPITTSPACRLSFTTSLLTLVRTYGFDGIDLDWEFPSSPQEAKAYLALMKELRTGLGDNKILTMASSGDTEHLKKYPLAEMRNVLDWVNVMTYDMSVGFSHARHHAPLYENPSDPSPYAKKHYNVDAVTTFFLNHFAPSQIVLGIPFYGHTYALDPTPSISSSQMAPGLFADRKPGSADEWITYRDMHARLQDGSSSGWKRYWDDVSKVPFAYHAEKHLFATFEDAQSLGEKLQYAEQKGLAGVMFWEYSQDLPRDDSSSLAATIHSHFSKSGYSFKSPWCSNTSPFCNIACPSASGTIPTPTTETQAQVPLAAVPRPLREEDKEEEEAVIMMVEDYGFDEQRFGLIRLLKPVAAFDATP